MNTPGFGHKSWRRGIVAGALAAAFSLLAATAAGAQSQAAVAASSGPTLLIQASGSTNVGLQIFANVNLVGGSNPTGTLTFRLYGPADTTCAAAPLFTSAVAVTGVSVNSDRYGTTVAGTYRWEVSYSGDANNAAAGPTACANPSASVIVGAAFTALTVTAQAPVAGTIDATATVTGYSPTGTVTFYLTPPGDMFCSTTPVFTSTVAVSGNGLYTSDDYTPPVGGQYKWRATYSGDNNNMAQPMTSCLDANASVTVGAPAADASFSNPRNGQWNVDTSVPFAWTAIPEAQGFYLTVGYAPLGTDLVSVVLPGSQTSYLVPPLPPGMTLYASIHTEVAGTWSSPQSVTFTAAAAWATFVNPVNGQSNVDMTRSILWTASPRAQAFFLTVGSTVGAWDLLWTGALPATQLSYAMPSLPAGTMYALIYTEINDIWYGQPITFTAVPTEAGLVTPTGGQANVSPTAPITWTTVSGIRGYSLWVGTTWYMNDVVNTQLLPDTQSSYTPTGLSAGQKLYVTLITWHADGSTSYQAFAFTTGPPPKAAISGRSALPGGAGGLATPPSSP